jgi:hypothetical protein
MTVSEVAAISFTSPPGTCFGEGWKPRWLQGSGKCGEASSLPAAMVSAANTRIQRLLYS